MAQTLVKFIQMSNENGNVPMKCHKCGYKWEYSGNAVRATCPSCGAKVRVSKHRLDKQAE